MIAVVIHKSHHGHTVGFNCSGHASYAAKGTDIVCAGVSTLTQTTVLALDQLLHLELRLKQNIKRGILECSWDIEPQLLERTELVVGVMLLGLNEIQKQYPQYLRLSEVEV